MFDGPSGTRASKNDRKTRDKYEEDELEMPRTKEEAEATKKNRGEDIVDDGDDVRTTRYVKGRSGRSEFSFRTAWLLKLLSGLCSVIYAFH